MPFCFRPNQQFDKHIKKTLKVASLTKMMDSDWLALDGQSGVGGSARSFSVLGGFGGLAGDKKIPMHLWAGKAASSHLEVH